MSRPPSSSSSGAKPAAGKMPLLGSLLTSGVPSRPLFAGQFNAYKEEQEAKKRVRTVECVACCLLVLICWCCFVWVARRARRRAVAHSELGARNVTQKTKQQSSNSWRLLTALLHLLPPMLATHRRDSCRAASQSVGRSRHSPRCRRPLPPPLLLHLLLLLRHLQQPLLLPPPPPPLPLPSRRQSLASV